MKRLKVIIIIFAIIIILLIGTLILLKKEKKEPTEEIQNKSNMVIHEGEEEMSENDRVKNPKEFYTVSACVARAVNVPFVPLQMRVKENDRVDQYIVYGITEKEEWYFLVTMDGLNATFSVKSIKNNYNNIFDISYPEAENLIEPNENNQYTEVKISDEFLCIQYFNLYKNIASIRPEIAYQFLEKEYKEKRFGSIENYVNFLNANKEEIQNLELKQYIVNPYEEYKEYVCKDQYGNLYIFDETELMEFTLKLDTYTIPTNNFTKTYASSSEIKKVQMNIDKWVQMLNNRDYTTAYQVLNETFRNNNFGSEESFETYMRYHYPSHYQIEFLESSKQGNTFIQTIKFKDTTSEINQEKKLDIIMKLEEGIKFVMSFNIDN